MGTFDLTDFGSKVDRWSSSSHLHRNVLSSQLDSLHSTVEELSQQVEYLTGLVRELEQRIPLLQEA